MVGVTSICKDILSKKDVNISMVKTYLSDKAQDAIRILSDLHSIHPMLNGCVMEAMIAFAYNYDVSNLGGSLRDKYFDVCGEIICKRLKDELEPFYINVFKVAISNTATNILDLYSNTFPASYKIFYIISYLILNNRDCEDWLTIEDLSKYVTKFLDNIITISDYIKSIKKNIDIESNFCVWCDFKSIGLDELNGKCDMVSDDWLIEIKCSNSCDFEEWFKQLEVYNLVMRKKNIGVINILTNEFIIYNNLGQITKKDVDINPQTYEFIKIGAIRLE